MKIQVGFLLSYDYELLKISIPAVYEYSDTIFLTIDDNRLTWNGNLFTIDDSFFLWVKEFDKDKKIKFYEDTFYIPNLTTMECEVRQRKMLANKMGIGNWLIQLDADEFFLSFKSFVKSLKSYNNLLIEPAKNQVQFSAFLINLYKQVDGGFLYVDKASKCIAATNYPAYKVGRNTRKRIIYTNNLLFHETLSRNLNELEFKFNNWGHKNELNPFFLEKWKIANSQNYRELEDLFYLEPQKWKKLNFVKGVDLNEAILNFPIENLAPSKIYIWRKNFGQWFKFLLK